MGGQQSKNCDLNGRVVLITSIANELCLRTAFDLIERGARVIIGCKNPEEVVEKMSKSVRQGKVELFTLDLCCDSAVLDFANHVKSRYNNIHIIIGSVEISQHAHGLSYLYQLLFDVIKKSGKLGEVCAKLLITFSKTLESKDSRKRNSNWSNSSNYSTMILVSCISLKHLIWEGTHRIWNINQCYMLQLVVLTKTTDQRTRKIVFHCFGP